MEDDARDDLEDQDEHNGAEDGEAGSAEREKEKTSG